MRTLLLIAALAVTTPAFADTQSPANKTDFSKPFIYDGLMRQAPPQPQDRPSVELRAKQLPPAQPIITPYSPEKPSK